METKLLLIPVIAGIIGYITNWIGVNLLFQPVHFIGIKIPGLANLAHYLPRKIQAIPGFVQGGIGWQGIIPSRAGKMGSIAVDKGISKLGSPREFYETLEPERIASQMLLSSEQDVRDITEEILEREHPQLWHDTPPRLREAVHQRIKASMPEILKQLTKDVGENIETLFNPKLMVIRQIRENPELANAISQGIGGKELRFVINSGLYFGFLLGIPQIFIFDAIDAWYILPIGGVIVGTLTNWMALKVIFYPVEPKKFGPFTLHGSFMRRQPEVAESYSNVVADDIVTLENLGDELLRGPMSDRTRALIKARLRPAADNALGVVQPAVRVAVGTKEYDVIRESLAEEAIDFTMKPFKDPEFNRTQADEIRELLRGRVMELPSYDYQELLRAAIREDEWMVLALGAQLGFVAGLLQIGLLFT